MSQSILTHAAPSRFFIGLTFVIATAPPLCAAPTHQLVDVELACGPASLAVAAGIVGRNVTREELATAFGGKLTGIHSLAEVRSAAHALGLKTRLLREEPEGNGAVPLPRIVAVQANRRNSRTGHFVVTYGLVNNRIQVIDFPAPPRLVPAERLREVSEGTGLYVALSESQLTAAGLPPAWLLPTVIAASALLFVTVIGQFGWQFAKAYIF